MAIPKSFADRLHLPVVVSLMFLVSSPDFFVACCKNGLVCTFPALNQRTAAGFEHWIEDIVAQLEEADAPFGINLIVHKTNPRVQGDLEPLCVTRCPWSSP